MKLFKLIIGLFLLLSFPYAFAAKLNQDCIKYIYDDDFTIVKCKGKFGLLSPENKILLPIKYNSIEKRRNLIISGLGKYHWDIYKNQERKGLYLIQNQGIKNILPDKSFAYISAFDPQTNLAVLCESFEYLNQKCGYVNRQGKIVIPLVYNEAEDFSEGLAKVILNQQTLFINENNEIKISLEKGAGARDMKHGMIEFYSPKTKKSGVVNKDNKLILPPEYDFVYIYTQEPYVVAGKNNLYGLWNNQGEVIAPMEFEDACTRLFTPTENCQPSNICEVSVKFGQNIYLHKQCKTKN